MLKQFFCGLPTNLLACFRGANLLSHALAIALTFVLVMTGADWWFYVHTRYPLLHPLVYAAGLGGFFVPVLVPVCLYIVGEMRKDARMMVVAGALAQAALIAYLISIFYKTFTGRIQPDFIYSIGTSDITHEFHFGILHNGIFWGWPSSHAAVAFALAAALWVLYERAPIGRYIALLYAILVAIGAAIGFHWLSDVLAGAIIGTLAGGVVAKRFLTNNPVV